MNKPLLIEVGVEELPAIPFLKELPNIKKKWTDILHKNSLVCNFDFFYTPRRLVLWHEQFPMTQPSNIVEYFGAPIKVAYKNGVPTNAAIAFSKKCDVKIEDLKQINKGKGPVLYVKKEVIGEKSEFLLNKMVNEFINSLNFGNSMRWGDKSYTFIRPIRSLSIILENKIVEGELFGVKSSNVSFSHRMVSYKPFIYEVTKDYFLKLNKNGVILYQDERKKLILEQMLKIENSNNVKIDIDKKLLDEVVALTEYPTALMGKFDKEFLQLPKEVIITSMKEHQRYFSVYKDDKLTNNFIVISNSKTTDFTEIIKGNEKVLRSRLSDAMFFYKNDIKNGLNNEGLKNIVFVEGLGSMYDKCQREAKITSYLAIEFNEPNKQLLQKTIMLSKADLISEMVYEFTELQGIMGYYYAKHMKEDELVYTSIKEQYLPIKEDSKLPSNKFSSIVSLSHKLDNLMALFSVKKIPTGSKDPFGLRRAAMGVIKIVLKHKLPLNLEKIVNNFIEDYSGLEKTQLLNFFNERLLKIFDVNPSVLKAVLGSGEKDIYELFLKINALNSIVQSDDFKGITSTFKRVSNIIKDINIEAKLVVKEKLFEQREEEKLYLAYKSVISNNYSDYKLQLNALFNLKPYLDKFFDNVFVNHENMAIKTNRKNLIGLIYQAFRNIADIKEITI